MDTRRLSIKIELGVSQALMEFWSWNKTKKHNKGKHAADAQPYYFLSRVVESKSKIQNKPDVKSFNCKTLNKKQKGKKENIEKYLLNNR